MESMVKRKCVCDRERRENETAENERRQQHMQLKQRERRENEALVEKDIRLQNQGRIQEFKGGEGFYKCFR